MTPILETLLPLVTQYAYTKARLWLEGSEELAKPDDDLASFLARHDVEWDQLEAAYQDSIRDTYLEAVREAMRRPVQSDSTTSASDLRPLLLEARAALKGYQKALATLFMGPYRADEQVAEGLLRAQSVGSDTLTKLQSIKA